MGLWIAWWSCGTSGGRLVSHCNLLLFQVASPHRSPLSSPSEVSSCHMRISMEAKSSICSSVLAVSLNSRARAARYRNTGLLVNTPQDLPPLDFLNLYSLATLHRLLAKQMTIYAPEKFVRDWSEPAHHLECAQRYLSHIRKWLASPVWHTFLNVSFNQDCRMVPSRYLGHLPFPITDLGSGFSNMYLRGLTIRRQLPKDFAFTNTPFVVYPSHLVEAGVLCVLISLATQSIHFHLVCLPPAPSTHVCAGHMK